MKKIIFIAGGSASGKTTLANKLRAEIQKAGFSCNLISMDDYFKEIPRNYQRNVPEQYYLDHPELSAQEAVLSHFRENTNFDRPEMIVFNWFKSHLQRLCNGETVLKPKLEFPANKRPASDKWQRIEPTDYLIVEGIFALHFAKMIEDEIDVLKVSVTTSSYLSLIETRVLRDLANGRRRDQDDTRARAAVLKQERRFVGPSFFNIVAKSLSRADVHVHNEFRDPSALQSLDRGISEVLSELSISHKVEGRGAGRDISPQEARLLRINASVSETIVSFLTELLRLGNLRLIQPVWEQFFPKVQEPTMDSSSQARPAR